MKRYFISTLLVLACHASALPLTAQTTPAGTPDAASTLWYTHPASAWMTEALPIGNGSLGAMLFGLTATERVQFNVNSLWTGDEKDTGAYQAFGDLFIQLNHVSPTGYRRELDIDRAVQRVAYTSGGIHYQRTAFASHPAKVIVLRLTADQPGAHSGRLWLTDMHGAKISAEGNRLIATGQLPKNGLSYESQVLVLASGGKLRVNTTPLPVGDNPLAGVPGSDQRPLPSACVEFSNCDSLTILLAADTNYVPDRSQNWRGAAPHAAVTRRLDEAARQPMDTLLAAHVADYQSLFHRFRLDLGKTTPDLAAKPTDERLLAYTKEKTNDPELEELFAQYGRYLLISSSRGGLPANLQGLWNDSNTPPWRCDYHSNINVEMNYWPAEPTNLSECHLPFIHYVDSLREVYRLRTREEKDYGPNVRGWTVRTENGIFGGGSYVWNPPASAWYAQDFWEHYAFTQDRDYLAETGYPMLKEICEFWEDNLVTRPDGTLVAPKGWSPEHGPTEPGVSYDQEIIYDLFTNYIDAADALKIDRPYRDKIARMRAKLLKPKIGRWGQLQEWETDRDDPKDRHRHVSHLFALYPGRQITATGTPELFKAAKVSLNARGDSGTGWSKAWKINFWARLLDGDRAHTLLRSQLSYTTLLKTNMLDGGGVYPNLLDAHPPFQIDGNFGATAGVAEMLVQSQTGEIVLLPALPSAWPTGSVIGLRARGGFEVSVAWKDGRLEQALIHAGTGVNPRVRYGDKIVDCQLGAGGTLRLGNDLKPVGAINQQTSPPIRIKPVAHTPASSRNARNPLSFMNKRQNTCLLALLSTLCLGTQARASDSIPSDAKPAVIVSTAAEPIAPGKFQSTWKSLSPRKLPGMNVNRLFKVVVVTPGQATGLEPATKTTEMRYNGRAASIRL